MILEKLGSALDPDVTGVWCSLCIRGYGNIGESGRASWRKGCLGKTQIRGCWTVLTSGEHSVSPSWSGLADEPGNRQVWTLKGSEGD